MFFLKDPFTGDIHGPVDSKKLKTMVLSEEIDLAWEVAKSEEGPWVNLSKVKGLPAPKVSTQATSIPLLYGASTLHVERHPQASKNTGFAKPLQEKARALTQKILAGSDNPRKVYVTVGLVVTTLVMAVFVIRSWPLSPVTKFEYYVWNPIVRRSSERKCFLRNKQGTFSELAGPTRAGKRYSYWEKVRYEAALDYEINETGSLTSPLEAVVRVTYLISRDVSNPADKMGGITRDDCVSASWGRPHERQVDGPYHYQYRNGTWQIAISKKQQALYTNDNGAINLPWPISDRELYEAERVNDFETPADQIYCRVVVPVCGCAADSGVG